MKKIILLLLSALLLIAGCNNNINEPAENILSKPLGNDNPTGSFVITFNEPTAETEVSFNYVIKAFGTSEPRLVLGMTYKDDNLTLSEVGDESKNTTFAVYPSGSAVRIQFDYKYSDGTLTLNAIGDAAQTDFTLEVAEGNRIEGKAESNGGVMASDVKGEFWDPVRGFVAIFV